ncbi:ROK family protein [Pseudoroseicyclus tamaricis]|uniref:Glucokinase n=1 Tax=Pseudoroseicyclus tamaricis TaxID=2705421 RepID=A0A6B2JRP6_9RHOB|nr:glucokinase [Pseudoroseicyclus tamaricis]NDV00660.1 glucokinase [Pseudoroseicyclus tamaricis]
MPKHPPNRYSLVADIGGTNTRVALADGRRVLDDTVRRYDNTRFPGLESVLSQYIEDEGGVDTRAACVAVAGPVRDGRATMTNLDWSIDKQVLARATRAEVTAILNDLQAQGHAIGHVPQENLRQILPFPEASPLAAKLVIGVGTGFNAALVLETARGRVVPPSESGHVNLPVQTEADMALARYVGTAHGFPAVEDVLSGRGIERVYAWLGEEAGDPREWRGRQIIEALEAGTDERAAEATAVFVRMMGIVAGNLALTQLPFGGVYFVGGMARAVAPHLARFDFGEAFRDKGRFAGFMSNFGVAVVEDDYAALTGCAAHLVHLSEQ